MRLHHRPPCLPAVCAGIILACAVAGLAPPQSAAQAVTVGMEFIAVPALDDFVTRVAQRPDGALSEEDILELCAAIDAPELEKPLLELKQRQLRIANKPKK